MIAVIRNLTKSTLREKGVYLANCSWDVLQHDIVGMELWKEGRDPVMVHPNRKHREMIFVLTWVSLFYSILATRLLDGATAIQLGSRSMFRKHAQVSFPSNSKCR